MTGTVALIIAGLLAIAGLVMIAWAVRKASVGGARRVGNVCGGLAAWLGAIAVLLTPTLQAHGLLGLLTDRMLLSRLDASDRSALGGWEKGGDVFREVQRRIREDELSTSARIALASRMHDDTDPSAYIRTRPVWPAGEQVWIEINTWEFYGLLSRVVRLIDPVSGAVEWQSPDLFDTYRGQQRPPWVSYDAPWERDWFVTRIPMARPIPADGHVRYRIELEELDDTVWTRDVTLAVKRVEAIDDVIEPIGDSDVALILASRLDLRVRVADGLAYVELAAPADACPDDVSVDLRVELLFGSEVVGTAELPPLCESGQVVTGAVTALFDADRTRIRTAALDDPQWVVRVVGVRDDLLAAIDVTSAWTGSWAVPLIDVLALPGEQNNRDP